ncbi:MAG: LD-carboxypeptidase [Lentisphaeria bacterium]|nr:LD-carboxypeptidase [Lentisphaeria bacterium]
MIGKLSAGSETEAKCFAGLFPPEIKTIAVTAPSMPGDAPEKVEECLELLRQAGINVKVMPHARQGEPGRTRADIIDVNLRAADFEQAWLDPEVDLILCMRGGWGGIDLIEKLDWEKLRQRPDMRVIGFSDVTTIHLAMLHEKAGHPLCGPSLRGLAVADQESLETFRTVVSGRVPKPFQLTVLRAGDAQGRILAGHLQRLSIMNRTRFKPETDGKVIFIECPRLGPAEVTEAWDNLRKDGFFKKCSAVVFGRLNGCGEEENTVIRGLASGIGCPVFCGFPYSHTPSNHMLDLWKSVRITLGGQLIFE